ncbi:MAG TPA: hypothetical protein EYI98_05440 [Candidatus Marinimicrobia bacterium]|jgi:hypothetical protein|nr:hypothetical protein [Candidatus Neomarinimicrobiota bacterium]|tara:strand:+ start:596 stop:979 length:384 start_codon:yes stop_codon:yes gene_type:complete
MNFESKLRKTFSNTSEMLDPEQFINKLTTARYAQALKRSQAISGYLAMVVVLVVGILGYNELDQGAILMEGTYYYSTNIISDQDEDSEYFDDLALYIIEQEEDIWMAFSFLDEIEYDKIVNLMENES